MKIAILGLTVSLLGCGGDAMDRAVRTANIARESGLYLHDTIETVCAPAYQTAESKEEYSKVEAMCGPARKAYLGLRIAVAVAIAVLIEEQSAKEPDAKRISEAETAVFKASRDLAEAVRRVKR